MLFNRQLHSVYKLGRRQRDDTHKRIGHLCANEQTWHLEVAALPVQRRPAVCLWIRSAFSFLGLINFSQSWSTRKRSGRQMTSQKIMACGILFLFRSFRLWSARRSQPTFLWRHSLLCIVRRWANMVIIRLVNLNFNAGEGRAERT